MNSPSFLCCILLLAAEFAVGQNDSSLRKRIFKISIADSGVEKAKGYLFDITDSSLKVGRWPIAFRNDAQTREIYKEVNYKQLSQITLKRSHGAGRGAWKGAVVGVLIGVAAGFIEGDDPEESWFYFSAGDKAVIYGALGAGVGTGIGALIGALIKKRFVIGGNRERFDEMKSNVLMKAYGTTTNSQQ
jgi:hypothetical protein